MSISSPEPPVFLLGPSRSGTTLLSTLLDAHPDIAMFPETWMFVALERLDCITSFGSPWQSILFMNELWSAVQVNDTLAARVVAEVAAEQPAYRGVTAPLLQQICQRYSTACSARFWGEKTPAHTLRLPMVEASFPQTRYLRLLRDPRDILASYARAWNQGQVDRQFFVANATIVKNYFHHLLNEEFWQAHPQNLRLTYEGLVNDPADTLATICHFLGCDYRPEMLQRQNTSRLEALSQHHVHQKLAGKIDNRSVERFREVFNESQIALIEEIFRQEMAILGYDPYTSESIRGEERQWLGEVRQRFQLTLKGRFRKKIRRQGKIKVWSHRLLGPLITRLPGRKLAVTRQDWNARIAQCPTKPEDRR